MVTPSIGSIVLVRFPFSDLSQSKLRPAVVLANSGRGDWILGQITSKPYADPKSIKLTGENFVSGSLKIISYVRPGKLFTANMELITKEVGILKESAHQEIVDAIISILKHPG